MKQSTHTTATDPASSIVEEDINNNDIRDMYPNVIVSRDPSMTLCSPAVSLKRHSILQLSDEEAAKLSSELYKSYQEYLRTCSYILNDTFMLPQDDDQLGILKEKTELANSANQSAMRTYTADFQFVTNHLKRAVVIAEFYPHHHDEAQFDIRLSKRSVAGEVQVKLNVKYQRGHLDTNSEFWNFITPLASFSFLLSHDLIMNAKIQLIIHPFVSDLSCRRDAVYKYNQRNRFIGKIASETYKELYARGRECCIKTVTRSYDETLGRYDKSPHPSVHIQSLESVRKVVQSFIATSPPLLVANMIYGSPCDPNDIINYAKSSRGVFATPHPGTFMGDKPWPVVCHDSIHIARGISDLQTEQVVNSRLGNLDDAKRISSIIRNGGFSHAMDTGRLEAWGTRAVANLIASFKRQYGKNVDIPKLPKEKFYEHRLLNLQEEWENFNHHLFFQNVTDIPGVRLVGEQNVDFINRNIELLDIVNQTESSSRLDFKLSALIYNKSRDKESQVKQKDSTTHEAMVTDHPGSQRHNPLLHPEQVGHNAIQGNNCLGGRWN